MNGLAELEHTLAARLLDAVRRYEMLAAGDRVLVAVSGGKDSFTLLHLLCRLREQHFPAVTFTACTVRTDIT
jgi:tRNA 2-thiocytidine biosynthesis protein TtcA